MKILPTSKSTRVSLFLQLAALKIIFIYTFLRFFRPLSKPGGLLPQDFKIFYTALDRLRAGQSFYVPTDSSPFKYSPGFLHLFEQTLGRLPPDWGWAVYLFCSLYIWFAGLHLWTRSVPRTSLFLFCLGWVACWHGFVEHMSYGQADFLIFGLFILSVLHLENSKNQSFLTRSVTSSYAAFLFAFALLIKPLSLFLATGPLLFKPSREKTFWVLKSLLLAAIILVLSGTQSEIQDWITSLAKQPAELFLGNINQSVLASTLRWSHSLHPQSFVPAGQFLCLGLLSILLALGLATSLISKQQASPRRGIAMGVLFYLLFNPLSWRWLSFAWILPFTSLNTKNKNPFFWLATILLIGLVLLLQQNISKYLGIQEIDELSGLGFYAIINILLTLLILQENENSDPAATRYNSYGQIRKRS